MNVNMSGTRMKSTGQGMLQGQLPAPFLPVALFGFVRCCVPPTYQLPLMKQKLGVRDSHC